MNSMFIYKVKIINDDWAIVFFNRQNNKSIIIKNDVEELRKFINQHKDCILIGANNYYNFNNISDDKILTSLIKYGDLSGNVTDEDITSRLPITLDITQGIVRNSLIDFHNMVCSLWENGHIFPYQYAVTEDKMIDQLVTDANLINFFINNNKERQEFLKWKLNVIKEYNLSKDAYHCSYGDITRKIIGLTIPDEETRKRVVKLDPLVEKAIKEQNNPFLNDLLKKLKEYYQSDKSLDKLVIKIDDCLVKFNDQGILGSVEKDYIDTNIKSDYAYLYIDFNSFGPNILINNNWLDGVCKHPMKYSEIKDRRIALKKDKNIQQLYYKYLLNSGLDYLNRVYTKNGENIGISLSLTGIMTMMLLYKKLEKYQTKLIECNTDGLIVKCPKDMVESINNEVNNLAKELNLSCDVHLVNRIVHFDTRSYIMEFSDDSQKHLGDFGLFQTHEYYCSGIEAVEKALREYYLNGIPVSVTLRNIRNNKDLKAFQIVKRQKKNEKTKYIKINDNYYVYDRSTIRLFAVKEKKNKNPLYVEKKENIQEKYKVKRGRSVQDGYYYFDLADQEVPDIYDIDLTYYINECYKIINRHPIIHIPEIMTSIKKNCFVDIDGTLIKNKSSELSYMTFYNSVKGLIKDEDIPVAYNLFSQMNGCYLLQFLRLCQKYKSYGTIDHFAEFLMSKGLFPQKDISVYKKFVKNYIENDITVSKNLEAFDDSKVLLDYLKSEGFNTHSYSDWFKIVQEIKLTSHHFDEYMQSICTIDDYYAKSSIKGWKDLLDSLHVSQDDFNIMIGNSTNDIVPKSINIPSIIVNHTGEENGKTVSSKGIIVNGFSEIINDSNFFSEIEKIKLLGKRK